MIIFCHALQMEKIKLETWLKDTAETIRRLKVTKEQLERELRKMKGVAETLEQTTVAERKHHEAENVTAEAECVATVQETAKLKRSVHKQETVVQRLETQLHAAKYATMEFGSDATETAKRIPEKLCKVDDDNVGDYARWPESKSTKNADFFDCIPYAKSADNVVAKKRDDDDEGAGVVDCELLDEINDLWDQVTHCGKLYDVRTGK